MPYERSARKARRCALLSIASTLAAAGAASPASAAWLPTDTLSPVGQTAYAPTVTVGASGQAVAMWGAHGDGLQASTREPGASWNASPTTLSSPGTSFMNHRTVVGDAGDVTALWGEYTMTMGPPPFSMPTMGPVAVYAATRPAGGTWGTPVLLSTPGVSSTVATLALGADGQVAALWTEGTDILVATRTPTGSWTAAAPIPSSGGTSSRIDAAFAPDGGLVAVWQPSSGGVRGAVRPAGGSWSAVATIAGVGFQPVLAVDGRGDATVAWIYDMKIFVAGRGAGGTWSGPAQVSVNGDLNYYSPAIATDPGGTVTVVWPQARNSGGGSVSYDQKAATRTPAGVWGSPVTIGSGESGGLVVAAGAGGRTTAAWRGLVGGSFVIQTATRAADGAWSTARDHSAVGAIQPAVAVDADGDAIVAWNESNRMKVQVDDAAPPRLRNLTVPQTATAGTPVTFTVSPLDLWSALGTTTWNFGDGSSATGTSVTHTYTTPANHTVTVTATDALGQPATGTATIAVSAPPAAPPPVLDAAPESKPTLSADGGGTSPAPKEGTELEVDVGRWSNATGYRVQFQRCASDDGTTCEDIKSATGRTYTVGVGDAGFRIRARVTAVNVDGVESMVYTAMTAKVQAAAVAAPAAPAPVMCVSNRVVALNWKLPRGVRASRMTVTVNGMVAARLKRSSRRYTLSLKGRPAGSATVTVSATTGRGVLKTVRTYRLCVAREASKKVPVLLLTRTGV